MAVCATTGICSSLKKSWDWDITPNSITVILSTTTYLSLRSPASNRSRTLLPVLLLKLLNAVTSLLFYLHWLKITERIEYKLLSLTYKDLRTTQPPYLHNLSLFNLLATLAPLITLPSLDHQHHPHYAIRITDRSFRYASPCLWNQLPYSLRQPHSSPSVSDFPADAPVTSSYSLNLPHLQILYGALIRKET